MTLPWLRVQVIDDFIVILKSINEIFYRKENLICSLRFNKIGIEKRVVLCTTNLHVVNVNIIWEGIYSFIGPEFLNKLDTS